jgi:hypothetical protein
VAYVCRKLKCVVAVSSVKIWKSTDRPNVNTPVPCTDYNLEQIPLF